MNGASGSTQLKNKACGRRPLHYDRDERTAAALLEAAIREGAAGARRVETEDSIWSWASLFKDLLTAELDAGALQRIRPALKEVLKRPRYWATLQKRTPAAPLHNAAHLHILRLHGARKTEAAQTQHRRCCKRHHTAHRRAVSRKNQAQPG